MFSNLGKNKYLIWSHISVSCIECLYLGFFGSLTSHQLLRLNGTVERPLHTLTAGVVMFVAYIINLRVLPLYYT